MSDAKLLVAVPKLNGTNYHLWQFKMQLLLRSKGLWKIVSGGMPKLTPDPKSLTSNSKGKGKVLESSTKALGTEIIISKEEATTSKKDEKALRMISATIEVGYDSRIKCCTT